MKKLLLAFAFAITTSGFAVDPTCIPALNYYCQQTTPIQPGECYQIATDYCQANILNDAYGACVIYAAHACNTTTARQPKECFLEALDVCVAPTP